MLLALLQEAESFARDVDAASGGGGSRKAVITLMIALPLISTCIVVFGGLRLKALLKAMPKISSKSHLEAYKSEHKLHAMLAVLIKAFLGIANVLFVIDLFVLGGPITDLVYSIVPSLISIAVSLPFRSVEQQVNEIPCATDDLRKEWVEVLGS